MSIELVFLVVLFILYYQGFFKEHSSYKHNYGHLNVLHVNTTSVEEKKH